MRNDTMTQCKCRRCGRIANVSLDCPRWACHACGDLVNLTAATAVIVPIDGPAPSEV